MKLLKKETHGHIQCYRQTGCRCVDCVEAKKDENKKYHNKEKHRLRMRNWRRDRSKDLEVIESKSETNLTLPPGMR